MLAWPSTLEPHHGLAQQMTDIQSPHSAKGHVYRLVLKPTGTSPPLYHTSVSGYLNYNHLYLLQLLGSVRHCPCSARKEGADTTDGPFEGKPPQSSFLFFLCDSKCLSSLDVSLDDAPSNRARLAAFISLSLVLTLVASIELCLSPCHILSVSYSATRVSCTSRSHFSSESLLRSLSLFLPLISACSLSPLLAFLCRPRTHLVQASSAQPHTPPHFSPMCDLTVTHIHAFILLAA
jgi:hypothetical protein